MAIEVGPHPAGAGLVMFHSTESGQFMPAERAEFVQLVAAVKAGVFDEMVQGRLLSASSAAAPGAAHPAEPEAFTVHGVHGEPVRAGAKPGQYPLTAACRGCGREIIAWRPSEPWHHSADTR